MASASNGHNLKTCKGREGIKLFGVQIDVNCNEEDESIRKSNEEGAVESIKKISDEAVESSRMNNEEAIESIRSNEEAVESNRRNNEEAVESNRRKYEEAVESIRRSNEEAVESIRRTTSLQLACSSEHRETVDSGYVSDGLIQSKKAKIAHEKRKRGVAWTEDEHRSFLNGLNKLGKGDWRGISKDYVKSRTPTQVASHAQYFFKTRSQRKKRRSFIFDLPFEENPQPPEATLALPTDQASEITREVSKSQIIPLKNTTETEGQASTSNNVLTAYKSPLSPAARPYGSQIAHFYPTPPYMVWMPGNIPIPRPTQATLVPLLKQLPSPSDPPADPPSDPQSDPQSDPPSDSPDPVSGEASDLEANIGGLSI